MEDSTNRSQLRHLLPELVTLILDCAANLARMLQSIALDQFLDAFLATTIELILINFKRFKSKLLHSSFATDELCFRKNL